MLTTRLRSFGAAPILRWPTDAYNGVPILRWPTDPSVAYRSFGGVSKLRWRTDAYNGVPILRWSTDAYDCAPTLTTRRRSYGAASMLVRVDSSSFVTSAPSDRSCHPWR